MKFDNYDSVLRIFLEGEINSYNSENVAKEIDDLLTKEDFKKLVLDFSNVSYISSAGLRIILRLKQKHLDVSVVETSLDVYDIFSMTGFTSIMSVKKALRKIYLSGAKVIGSGYFSTVYRLNDDTIVKVFNHIGDEDQIERELALSKEAFLLGIPTAISYDIVKVGDQLGVCFEMLDCQSLKDVVANNREKALEYVNKYAELLKKINSLECVNPIIPDIKKHYLEKLEELKPDLSKESFDKAHKLLCDVPERHTLVHGDCHFKNILVQNDNLLLIDMETLSVGHPIFELASLFSSYVGFGELNPEETLRFFDISNEDTQALFNILIDRYFGKDDPVIKDKIAIVGYINVCRWYKKHNGDSKMIKMYIEKLVSLLNKYEDLQLGI